MNTCYRSNRKILGLRLKVLWNFYWHSYQCQFFTYAQFVLFCKLALTSEIMKFLYLIIQNLVINLLKMSLYKNVGT